ncbi:MAG: HNH endonuclease signature motif containing protein [Micromonosporaceae bacterium]
MLGSDSIPLDVGRTIRLFTRAQRRALILRDRGCAFPGCDRPAHWCEAHHIRHWVDGGATDLHNGVLLCGYHHRVIHKGKWRVRIRHGVPEFLSPHATGPLQKPMHHHSRHRKRE